MAWIELKTVAWIYCYSCCCTKIPDCSGTTHLSPRFTCKTLLSQSGAEGSRTPDLRRAKAVQYILDRSSLSGDLGVLQVFCRITEGTLSIVYQRVSARLQYIRASPTCSG